MVVPVGQKMAMAMAKANRNGLNRQWWSMVPVHDLLALCDDFEIGDARITVQVPTDSMANLARRGVLGQARQA